MNIAFLYVSEILDYRGGVQRVTTVLADYFESKGNNVYYLSLLKVENNAIISARQHFFPESEYNQTNIEFYEEFLKKYKIDIVINQSGIRPDFSNLACYARKKNVIVVSAIHNSLLSGIRNFSSYYKNIAKKAHLSMLLPLADTKAAQIILPYLYKLKYHNHYQNLCKESDTVILLSEKLKEELYYLTNRTNIPNLVSISNPVPFIPIEVDFNAKKKELLYVGRIDTIFKRVDLLLEIWKILYLDFPDWKLKIVGGGIELESIVNLSKKMDLRRVYFEDFQDPGPYYQDASIFCMTSSNEGFGMVLLEAMQYGVVPFAFNSYPSVVDIIDHKKNGILIPPFNCNKYAAELGILMRDETQRLNIALNSIEKSKNFSIEKIGNRWLELLNNLMLSKQKLN